MQCIYVKEPKEAERERERAKNFFRYKIFSGRITIHNNKIVCSCPVSVCVCCCCGTHRWNSNATVPNWRLIAHKLNIMIFAAMMSSSSLY